MNREIKYRFWNVEKNLMMEPSHNIMVNSYDGTPYFLFGYDVPMPEPNWTPMQFTGLQDKNGKEIFEGDVVKLAGYGRYEVAWPFFELFEASHENDIEEILGNIHENPDLLNSTALTDKEQ